ncbi:GCN5-related protein N-acetyltransferase [Beutenbergia cavernae DSM 12333]|uniref:GCN5-related protein N-acetyltransferase n=1 Tax=Beutenbergia cavernae (strain ATCC BAA-8 / DSM 12333 / CCUG 43141 / JCM 11478 / NBRC 16432 / NCIMB 13614 / HKI 0122) TaxID=471853 RepID=C5BY17_BEUC1|nr:GNAT family N-acetyltransferase [Beutenbergia cavernae]ACQ78911.1 GCN5-related protein N-acetyltransferase [Beutenbergia cavernae DSM 12333]
MEIRDRRDGDADALVRILADVHARDGYPVRRSNVRREWLWDPAFLGAWVAVVDGDVVGHIAVDPRLDAPGVPPGTLGVSRLFVAWSAHGRGVGAALLDRVRAFAGSRALGLEVTDDSVAARALYERLGWRLVGTASASWTDAAGRHPELTYFLAPDA